jgi:hypothetical protein
MLIYSIEQPEIPKTGKDSDAKDVNFSQMKDIFKG